MVTVIEIDRRSAVLTPSGLACLSRIPTVNLTSGCAHGCIYCYARGYTNYPGEGRVIVYKNTLEKLKAELTHKRAKPEAVYFSPSSDLFQPIPEVLDLAHDLIAYLFSQGIGVAFVSKGLIPERTMRLLLENAGKVRAQIGIVTLEEETRRIFEPNTASAEIRLRQMARLIEDGAAVEARLAPILPEISDHPEAIDRLFAAIAKTGVRAAAASLLFLRPRIIESLRRHISEDESLKPLLARYYTDVARLAVRTSGSSIIAVPRPARKEILERVRSTGEGHSIKVSICACMNPDITEGICNISGTWPHRSKGGVQIGLPEGGG